MKNPNIKQVGGKTLTKCYGPNFYRFEQDDEDTGSYHIYINNEEVEWCPISATLQEVQMRFHDLLEENGIEWTSDEDMYVWKEL